MTTETTHGCATREEYDEYLRSVEAFIKPRTGGLATMMGIITDLRWGAEMDNKPQTTDTADLAVAIQDFEAALPGWWFSVGKCSLTRDASCGPDLAYEDAWLLKLPDTRVFDEGFHCDDPEGSLASSLRNVMKQALEEKAKWKKQ